MNYIEQHYSNTGNIEEKEDKSNKVTSITNTSTDTEYPSAKAVYTYVESKPTPTPTSKYDYIVTGNGIDQNSGQPITDEETIACLEEINNNYLDENGKVKPLKIGMYVGNGDQDIWGYFTDVVQIGKDYNGNVALYFVTTIDVYAIQYVYYNNTTNKWYCDGIQIA